MMNHVSSLLIETMRETRKFGCSRRIQLLSAFMRNTKPSIRL
ncbi:hypothetical protein PO124_11300 [Bacillus licheniformis]|nr:hypothetical protein [Bacillus licheniformis]